MAPFMKGMKYLSFAVSLLGHHDSFSFPFTREEQVQIVQLARQGESISTIARILDAFPESVHEWILHKQQEKGQTIALHLRPLMPEQKSRAIGMLAEEGKSLHEIAGVLNVDSFNLVQQLRAEAVQLVRDGHSFEEVARMLETNPNVIRKWIRTEEQQTGQSTAPRQKRFTPEQKKKAIELVHRGHSFTEVARIFKTNPSTIHRWVRAEEQQTGRSIAPRQKRFTPEQKKEAKEAIELVHRGHSFTEVARRFGTSPRTIYRWVSAEEQQTGRSIAPRQKRFTPEQKKEAIELVHRGHSFTEVARIFKTGPSTIRRWVRAEEQQTGRSIHRKRFTPEQKKKAIELVHRGHSFTEVARIFKTGPSTIHRWVRAEEQQTGRSIAPRRKRFTPEQKKEAIELVHRGHSFAEVARRFGADPSTIRKLVRTEEQQTGRSIAPRRKQTDDSRIKCSSILIAVTGGTALYGTLGENGDTFH